MLNLLPPDTKAELRAARTNTVLRRYLVTSLFGCGAVVIMLGAAIYFNEQNYQTYKLQREQSDKELAKLNDVKKMVADYNDKLKLAEDAYGSEVKITNLITNFSSVLPPGAILNSISFNVESFSEPVMITASVNSFEKAGVLKRNLAQSTFFTDVTLQQVSNEAGTESAASTYPFVAQLEVTLTPEAAEPPVGRNAL